MASIDPLEKTYPIMPLSISKRTYPIAGILTTVYGLSELSSDIEDIVCLWLLHPRLKSQSSMEPLAHSIIGDWNRRIKEGKTDHDNPPKGLIAVSFDQRNHGTRKVDDLANEAWRSGNPRHAQDMFSVYSGTALDTSLLITYLSSYVFPESQYTIITNYILGVSLGGHAAWQCLLHDPRVSTAVIIIGCPDYVRLMTDRARLSKLETWISSSPPGSNFLGSKDFPPGLIEAIHRWDPSGFLMPQATEHSTLELDGSERGQVQKILPRMKNSLGGKRILNLSGGADKLVPYRCSEPFLTWLKKAIAPGEWFQDGDVLLEDIIIDGKGHEVSPEMVTEAVRFVSERISQESHNRDKARPRI
ncbi:MAG: hypothetical protein M1834_006447 [Cirrosporium novae-zelandiae]|nr:MAG: hypothetical protein M1834_006447 [Cirrosporium novae-zelandiae]